VERQRRGRQRAGSRLTGDVARWIEDAAAAVSSPG
jgi:molybdenum-dependent DNA-binding transcriptional regulator ModE